MVTAAAAVSRTHTPQDRMVDDLTTIARSIAEQSPKNLAALTVLAKMMLENLERPDAPSPPTS